MSAQPTHLVERVVPADVLARAEQLAVRREQPAGVQPAGLPEHRLRLAQPPGRASSRSASTAVGATGSTPRSASASMLSSPQTPQALDTVNRRAIAAAATVGAAASCTVTVLSRSSGGDPHAVPHREDVLARAHHALAEQEAGGELEVVAGRAHGHRQREVAARGARPAPRAAPRPRGGPRASAPGRPPTDAYALTPDRHRRRARPPARAPAHSPRPTLGAGRDAPPRRGGSGPAGRRPRAAGETGRSECASGIAPGGGAVVARGSRLRLLHGRPARRASAERAGPRRSGPVQPAPRAAPAAAGGPPAAARSRAAEPERALPHHGSGARAARAAAVPRGPAPGLTSGTGGCPRGPAPGLSGSPASAASPAARPRRPSGAGWRG